MIFKKTSIDGPCVIEFEPHADARGFFARNFCVKEMKENTGEDFNIVQVNLSSSARKGTLRGFHFQKFPMREGKIVQCLRGSVFDVAVDLRPNSSTFGKWVSCELSPDKKNLFYIPKGFGHGIQTLEDSSLVQYFFSQFYSPAHDAGIRWDDGDINVLWPMPPTIISERDKQFPYLKDVKF